MVQRRANVEAAERLFMSVRTVEQVHPIRE